MAQRILPPYIKGVVSNTGRRPGMDMKNLFACWYYNYTTQPKPLDVNIPGFLPMLTAYNYQPFASPPVIPTLPEGQLVMFLNEPNEGPAAGGCNLTPAQAADLFVAAFNQWPTRLFLGPNMSQGGLAWLQNYMGEVYARLSGPHSPPFRHADIGFHHYDLSMPGAKTLCNQFKNLAASWGLNVWNTEFRWEDTDDEEEWAQWCYDNVIPYAHFKNRCTDFDLQRGGAWSTPLLDYQYGTYTEMGQCYTTLPGSVPMWVDWPTWDDWLT